MKRKAFTRIVIFVVVIVLLCAVAVLTVALVAEHTPSDAVSELVVSAVSEDTGRCLRPEPGKGVDESDTASPAATPAAKPMSTTMPTPTVSPAPVTTAAPVTVPAISSAAASEVIPTAVPAVVPTPAETTVPVMQPTVAPAPDYAANGWQPESATHNHGSGTDAGVCPACGIIYGPAGGAEGQYGAQDGMMD